MSDEQRGDMDWAAVGLVVLGAVFFGLVLFALQEIYTDKKAADALKDRPYLELKEGDSED